MKYIKYLLWIIVIFIMSAIFMFSAQNGEKSDDISEKFSIAITDGKYTPNENKSAEFVWTDNWTLNGVVRKAAHFSVYLSLGLFLFLALVFTFNKKEAWFVAISLVICLLYAVSDEIHQLFVSGRSGSIKDVLIDFSGSSIGIFLSLIFKNKFLKSNKKY